MIVKYEKRYRTISKCGISMLSFEILITVKNRVYSLMMEYSGIRIDEINLRLTIIVWNKSCVSSIHLQQNLIIIWKWKTTLVLAQHNSKKKKNKKTKKKRNKPDFEECIDPIEDLTAHELYN